MGSMVTSLAPGVAFSFAARASRSPLRLKARSRWACLTASIMWTRSRLAPHASRRGRMVSAGSSSAERRSTSPAAHTSPVDQVPPLDVIAAKYVVICDFPSPGCPAISEFFPSAIRSGQSQRIASGWTSAARREIRRDCSPAWSVSVVAIRQCASNCCLDRVSRVRVLLPPKPRCALFARLFAETVRGVHKHGP